MSSDVQHPGLVLLQRYLQPLGITPRRLAVSLGISPRRISDLIKGRRSITQDMAARLALFFDVPVKWWLELQARYDAAHLSQMETLRQIVTPYEGLADVLVTPHGVKRLAPVKDSRMEASTATFSQDFVARLRAQAKLAKEDSPRTVSERTFADGTVALVGS